MVFEPIIFIVDRNSSLFINQTAFQWENACSKSSMIVLEVLLELCSVVSIVDFEQVRAY